MKKLKLTTPKSFYDEFERRPGSDKENTHYCSGCGHGIIHKLIAEALDDFGIQDRTILISPVGCAVFAYYYMDVGNIQTAHGRAPAIASAIKRAHPESIVISYQGDGDLAAIGGNNLIQAANRGDNFTTIFINNAIYGMTGGQMAPTTLLGQKTTTSPFGRKDNETGVPIRICELLAALEPTVYLERVSLHNPAHINKTRRAIRKALQNQVENRGYSLVEVLSPCPPGWKTDTPSANRFIEEKMVPVFPLGVYKDNSAESEFHYPPKKEMSSADISTVLEVAEANLSAEYRSAPRKESYRNPSVKIAGFGGQGVLLLGEALAETAMYQGYNVSWIPSYGPEMRGGTANCQATISDERIGSPLSSTPDVLIALNKQSLEKFATDVRAGGIILYNTSLIDIDFKRADCEVIPIPFSKLGDEAGNLKTANMVALGAYVRYTGILEYQMVIELLPEFITRKNLIEVNKKAILKGVEAVETFVRSAAEHSVPASYLQR